MVGISQVIGAANERFGLGLDASAYSGMWCHRLPDSDQIAVQKAGHQSHVAVTGDSMLLFPVVTSVDYEQNPTLNQEKTRFVLSVNLELYRDNLVSLLQRAPSFSDPIETPEWFGVQEERISGSGSERIQSRAECRFRIQSTTRQRQMQIGFIGSDDQNFTALRRCLKSGDYLVMLLKGAAEFDVIGLPSEVSESGPSWENTIVPPASPSQAIMGTQISLPSPTALPSGDRILQLLQRRKNVILYGPPGTGKTYHALRIAASWEEAFGDDSVFRVTFHPSYSYEDFVQGFRPDEADPSTFTLQHGILLDAIDRAKELLTDGNRSVLLMIDEINRADVARVFGELITYIEQDKRGQPVSLAQSPKTIIEIPPNLAFLGTMNTADKSVSLLDVALRRRFAFVEFRPDPKAFDAVPDWVSEIQGLQLGSLLDSLNARLSAIGVTEDRSIGQALLAVDATGSDAVNGLSERLELDVFPLVEEYCYFDRRRIKEVLGPLVDEDGRWKPPSQDVLIAALKVFVGQASEADGTAELPILAEEGFVEPDGDSDD